MSGKRESAHKKCRRSLQRHEHRAGRGLAGCGRARATTAPHDAAEAQAGVCSDSDSEESETGSDGEWSGDDDPLSDHGREDEDEDEPVLRGRKADETSCSEEEGEEEEHVSNAQRGCVRLHGVVQSSTGLEVDDDRRKRLGEKGWARRSVVVCAVGPSGAAVFEAVLGREEYGSGEDGAVEWEKNMLEFADGNFNDAGMRYERRDVERQRARWHDPVLRRWLGLTPKRPALCLRWVSQGDPGRP